MKVIFLDIDGVMNSSIGKEPYLADMEVLKLKLLKKIIIDSGSTGIVLTSDRRYSNIYMKEFINVLKEFDIKLVGITRKKKEYEEDLYDNRGKEIMDYLIESNSKIEKFVILDDMDDGISNLFNEKFILVNRFYGLNEEVYSKTIELLMS